MLTASSNCFIKILTKAEASSNSIIGSLNWKKMFFFSKHSDGKIFKCKHDESVWTLHVTHKSIRIKSTYIHKQELSDVHDNIQLYHKITPWIFFHLANVLFPQRFFMVNMEIIHSIERLPLSGFTGAQSRLDVGAEPRLHLRVRKRDG